MRTYLSNQIKALIHFDGYLNSSLYANVLNPKNMVFEVNWSSNEIFRTHLNQNQLEKLFTFPTSCVKSFNFDYEIVSSFGNSFSLLIDEDKNAGISIAQDIIDHNYDDQDDALKEKYASSNISEDQINEFLESIISCMAVEKPFLDRNLTLVKFSKDIEIHPHHVSRVINEKLSLNFSNFVNSYRVKHSKKLLVKDLLEKYTISGIGNEAGFNSRSAFYNSFKKFTGMSPGDFVDKENPIIAYS